MYGAHKNIIRLQYHHLRRPEKYKVDYISELNHHNYLFAALSGFSVNLTKSLNECSSYICFADENTIPHLVSLFVLEAVVLFLIQIILQMRHHENTNHDLTTTRKLCWGAHRLTHGDFCDSKYEHCVWSWNHFCSRNIHFKYVSYYKYCSEIFEVSSCRYNNVLKLPWFICYSLIAKSKDVTSM